MKIDVDDIDEQNNPTKIYLPKNYYKVIPSQQSYQIRKNYNNYQTKYIKPNLVKSNLKTISSMEENRTKHNFDYLSQKIGKNDPKPIQPEKSFQFKKIVYKLEANEIISLNKACELLGVTIDEYNSENNNY